MKERRLQPHVAPLSNASASQRRKGEAARITLKLPVTHCHLPRLPQAPEEYTQKKPNAAFSTLPIQMCGWRR